MLFLYDFERLKAIISHYLGIDISLFTDYQIVVIGLLIAILTILSAWFIGKILYSIYCHITH